MESSEVARRFKLDHAPLQLYEFIEEILYVLDFDTWPNIDRMMLLKAKGFCTL